MGIPEIRKKLRIGMEMQTENLNSLFYELIKVAIGNQESLSRQPSMKEWKALFEIAKKQSLIGVCFAALQRLGADADEGFARIGMSEMLYFHWIGMAATIQKKNEIVNQQCVALQKQLYNDGFKSCILKGQGVGQLYAKHIRGLRQSGDIDIWVDADEGKTIEYVMQYYPTNDFGLRHIQFKCFPDTKVELHWIPASTYNVVQMRTLRRYFDSERNRQFYHRTNELCVPTSDFQVVHQILHVYNHYMYEGVGMRQMMDLFYAQLTWQNCSEVTDERPRYNEVLELFKKLGLLKFVSATQWVLQEVFCMTENVLLCAPDEKEGRKMLKEILIGGNFGQHDERNYVEGESFIGRFHRRWGRKFRMFRFDPLGALLMPFSRLQLEFWMRSVRRKYNV